MVTSRVGHVLSIQFGDNHVVWSEANYYYSWHVATKVILATKVIFNCIIQPVKSWIKIACKITFISTSAPTLRQTLSRHNNSNIFKGTAKKTKTNSLWIVLTYAMWNSLILHHWYLIPYSVSVSVFVIPFPFPDSGFRVLVLRLFIYLAPN